MKAPERELARIFVLPSSDDGDSLHTVPALRVNGRADAQDEDLTHEVLSAAHADGVLVDVGSGRRSTRRTVDLRALLRLA